MKADLFYPMFATVMLTVVIGLITIYTRIRDARSGAMDPRYFKTFNFGTPTEAVVKTGRHFNNLFEVPTLFYAACLAGMVTGVSGALPLAFAWLFVFARVLHAWIHIGSNKVLRRMSAFVFGFTCMVGLWICVLLRVMEIGSVGQ